MKKRISLILAVLMILTAFSGIFMHAAADTAITSVSFKYDTKGVALSTSYTGQQVSEALNLAIDESSFPESVHIDHNCSYLVKRNGDEYQSLKNSNEKLNTGDEYYFLFNLEDSSGYYWAEDLPAVKINNATPYLVRWYSEDKSSVDVLVRAYVTGDNYVAEVTVDPKTKVMQKGSAFTFSASVVGSVSTVSWSVSGANSSNTNISNAGKLTVGSNETSSEIKVYATSTFNSNARGVATVTVIDEAVQITSVSIDPDTATIHGNHDMYFTPVVVGTDEHDVTWNLTGNNHTDTKVTPVSDGRCSVFVAKNETATSLTLTATSVKDPTKSGTCQITVVPTPLIDSITLSYDKTAVTLNTSLTGKQVSQAFQTALETCTISSNVHVDRNCSYLVKPDDEGDYIDLKNSDELLTTSEMYYLVVNFEDEYEYAWDPDNLPSITINGSMPDDVRWYSPDKSSLNAYIRVYLEGTAPTYTVYYDRNGGSGGMPYALVEQGDQHTLRECEFYRDGYKFDYWFLEDAPSNKLYPGDKITVTKTVTVYAAWKEATYSAEIEPITFEPIHVGYGYYDRPHAQIKPYNTGELALHTDGASVYIDNEDAFYVSWAAVDPLVDPGEYMDYMTLWVKEDLPAGTYTTNVYFKDYNGKVGPISIQVSITVMSEEEVYVTFDNNDVGDPIPGIIIEKGMEYKYARRLAGWPKPAYPGKVFDDWYYDKACEDHPFPDETIDSDITFYAKWYDRIEDLSFTLDPVPDVGNNATSFLNVSASESRINIKTKYWATLGPDGYDPFTGTFQQGTTYYLILILESKDDNAVFEYDPNNYYMYYTELSLNGKSYDDNMRYMGYSDSHQLALIFTYSFADPPAAPVIAATNVYGTGIKVSWNAVDGADKYIVYRNAGDGWVRMKVTDELSFTDTNCTGGVKYTYYVNAYSNQTDLQSESSNTPAVQYNPFKDVKTSESYFKYLMWAYNNGVIMGTSATTFNPNGDCKRCDLAVMLYRMYGKPSVSGQSIPFKDVKSSDYYYKAVVWAYNQGYIKGTSATTFNPKGSISRQDMVVILWRMAGSPKVNIENPFKDVSESSYAYKAIMWAYKNKITSGTSATKFSPKSNCLRYQLAVFLNKFNNIVHVIS